jgi:uncharacterized protein (DUF2147 family)
MSRNLTFCVTLGLVLSTLPASAEPAGLAGNWTTLDDKSGEARSVIAITVTGGVAEGTVAKMFKKPGESGLCKHCDGALKDKPIVGMKILTNLRQDGDVWDGGSIFDPGSGNTYDVRMHLIDGGRKLEVRGFLGLSLLGRTQTWLRSE